MGKIIATYLVKITVREVVEGDLEAGNIELLTNQECEAAIAETLTGAFNSEVQIHVESERTDR